MDAVANSPLSWSGRGAIKETYNKATSTALESIRALNQFLSTPQGKFALARWAFMSLMAVAEAYDCRDSCTAQRRSCEERTNIGRIVDVAIFGPLSFVMRPTDCWSAYQNCMRWC